MHRSDPAARAKRTRFTPLAAGLLTLGACVHTRMGRADSLFCDVLPDPQSPPEGGELCVSYGERLATERQARRRAARGKAERDRAEAAQVQEQAQREWQAKAQAAEQVQRERDAEMRSAQQRVRERQALARARARARQKKYAVPVASAHLCALEQTRDEARAEIGRERATARKYSGVVDVSKLYDLGNEVREYDEEIARWKDALRKNFHASPERCRELHWQIQTCIASETRSDSQEDVACHEVIEYVEVWLHAADVVRDLPPPEDDPCEGVRSPLCDAMLTSEGP